MCVRRWSFPPPISDDAALSRGVYGGGEVNWLPPVGLGISRLELNFGRRVWGCEGKEIVPRRVCHSRFSFGRRPRWYGFVLGVDNKFIRG